MKVIQAGIGGMGAVWLQTVLTSPEVEYAALVEINDDTAAIQAEKFGLKREMIFRSMDEALANVQADGIIDITPPQFHKSISLMALDAGLPVLSEKPLASTFEDALAIVEKSNLTGVLHMVAQNYRYSTPAQTLKQVLMSGEMGRIGAVSVEFYKGPHFGGFREEMPYPLVIDMAIHHFDLMRYLIGSDPISVYGQSWNPAWSWFKGDASAAVSITFQNGVAATYNGSWCASGRETSWNGNWRFDCEHGVVSLIDDNVYVQHWIGTQGFNNLYSEVEPIAYLELPRMGQAHLLYEFYAAVKLGGVPSTTCQDNIKSLAVVFGAVKSFETGQPVQVGEWF
jgi:predicted dehydrogenase